MNKAEIHTAICERLCNTYRWKNSDYGDSFAETRKEYPEAICLRLQDKINRLRSLIGREDEAEVKDESIEDTLLDIANYAIMEIIERTCETTVYSLQKEYADSIENVTKHFDRADKKETKKAKEEIHAEISSVISALDDIPDKYTLFGSDEIAPPNDKGYLGSISGVKVYKNMTYTSDTKDRAEKKCETCGAWGREPMCGGLVARYGKCAKAKGAIKCASGSCDKWEASK